MKVGEEIDRANLGSIRLNGVVPGGHNGSSSVGGVGRSGNRETGFVAHLDLGGFSSRTCPLRIALDAAVSDLVVDDHHRMPSSRTTTAMLTLSHS